MLEPLTLLLAGDLAAGLLVFTTSACLLTVGLCAKAFAALDPFF